MRRLQAKRDSVLDRFHEVEARMGAASDGAEIARLGKEYAELKPVADAVQGLARAAAVILVGDGDPDLQDFRGLVLRARLAADGAAFAGKPVFAFAGIGRPKKFIASLEDSGALLAGSCFFPDHHPYSENEISELKAIAGEASLVTTEKDFVRMTVAQRGGIQMLKVKAMFDDPAALTRLLDSLPAWV